MSDKSTITVLFTCHKCGLQRVRLEVTKRKSDEDVADWVKTVAQNCGDRHCFLAPQCPERQVDLLIPMPVNKTDGIGMSAQEVLDMEKSDLLNSKGAN